MAAARRRAESALGDLESLEQAALEKSLRLFCGLQQLAADKGWNGFATRCWPECFTEFGAAACAPQAMMTNDGIPGGCEADAYGTLTSLILKTLADEPPFVADLVMSTSRTIPPCSGTVASPHSTWPILMPSPPNSALQPQETAAS